MPLITAIIKLSATSSTFSPNVAAFAICDPEFVPSRLIGNSPKHRPDNGDGNLGGSHCIAPECAAKRFVGRYVADKVRSKNEGKDDRWKSAVCPIIEGPCDNSDCGRGAMRDSTF
jgi:hypothetical protein